MARDIVAHLPLLAAYLVHKGLLGAQEHDGKPAGILIVVKVGHEHVGGLSLLGLGELGRDELRDLLRQIHELALAKEIALELAAKRRVLGKRGTLVIGRSAGTA